MLTKEQLRNLHNYLYLKYKKEMAITFEELAEDDFGAYIQSRKIVIPNKVKNHQTEWTLFAFLHEIGHIKTNTSDMKRYEQEYLATKWALEEAKKIGFNVPTRFINTYQNYIWGWREKSIKLKGKNICRKEELTLTA